MEEEFYVALGLFMLTGIIQKHNLTSYFITKKVNSMPGFGNIRHKTNKLTCNFLHFANNEPSTVFNACRNFTKDFRLQEMY
jgi:hypothetical protein